MLMQPIMTFIECMIKGYLVVASMNGMTEHIVGTFGKPSDGQVLDCQLKNNNTIAKVQYI